MTSADRTIRGAFLSGNQNAAHATRFPGCFISNSQAAFWRRHGTSRRCGHGHATRSRIVAWFSRIRHTDHLAARRWHCPTLIAANSTRNRKRQAVCPLFSFISEMMDTKQAPSIATIKHLTDRAKRVLLCPASCRKIWGPRVSRREGSSRWPMLYRQTADRLRRRGRHVPSMRLVIARTPNERSESLRNATRGMGGAEERSITDRSPLLA